MIGIERAELLDAIRLVVREVVAGTLAAESPVALTVEATAARLGCRRTQVFALLRSGRLKRGEKAGRTTMVLLASVEAFERGATQPKPNQPRRRVRGLEARMGRVPLDGGSSR